MNQFIPGQAFLFFWNRFDVLKNHENFKMDPRITGILYWYFERNTHPFSSVIDGHVYICCKNNDS